MAPRFLEFSENICAAVRRRSEGVFITLGIALAVVGAGLILFVGWYFAIKRGPDFWSNFLVNVAAGLLGLAIAATVASIVAKKRFDVWLPAIIDLIANLRRNQNIDGPTARSAVVCAVRIFSEGRFLRVHPAIAVLTDDAKCQICLEPACIKDTPTKQTCMHCLLTVDVSQNAAYKSLDRGGVS